MGQYTLYPKLKTIHYQQKHVTQILFNEEILSHLRLLLQLLNALNFVK